MNADGTPSCSEDVTLYEHAGDAWLTFRKTSADAYVCIADFDQRANAALVVELGEAPGSSRIACSGGLCRELIFSTDR